MAGLPSQTTDQEDEQPQADIETLAKQTPECNNKRENKNLYTQQGNAYISAAVQHAEEGQLGLAEHLAEEAEKSMSLQRTPNWLKSFRRWKILKISYNGTPLFDSQIHIFQMIPMCYLVKF